LEQKRSRWNAPGTKAFIPGVPHLIPRGIEKECMEALLGTRPLFLSGFHDAIESLTPLPYLLENCSARSH
jgi:hypothetical protein